MAAPVNADTAELLRRTGPWADADARGQLAAYLAGPGSVLQVLDDLVRDTPTDPGWSVLLDVDRCPTYALPWLGQFVGVRFDSNTLTDAQQRQAIRAEQGFDRGTVAALTSIARRYLTGTHRVDISERTPDPYSFTITVYQSELIGLRYSDLTAQYPTYSSLTAAFATYGGYSSSQTELMAALMANKPAGLLMTLVVSTSAP